MKIEKVERMVSKDMMPPGRPVKKCIFISIKTKWTYPSFLRDRKSVFWTKTAGKKIKQGFHFTEVIQVSTFTVELCQLV